MFVGHTMPRYAHKKKIIIIIIKRKTIKEFEPWQIGNYKWLTKTESSLRNENNG